MLQVNGTRRALGFGLFVIILGWLLFKALQPADVSPVISSGGVDRTSTRDKLNDTEVQLASQRRNDGNRRAAITNRNNPDNRNRTRIQNLNPIPNLNEVAKNNILETLRAKLGAYVNFTYANSKVFDANDLPLFFALLENPEANGVLLQNAAFFIAFIGRGDDQAAESLMRFSQRPVDWARWGGEHDAVWSWMAKAQALDALGYVGGDKAMNFLKYAITPEGAHEITKGWLNSMPDYRTTGAARVVDEIRGRAAKGLAYYGDRPEIRDLIVAAYSTEKKRLIDANKIWGDTYFNDLVEAMTRMDIIKKIGLEGHSQLYTPDPMQIGNAYRAGYREGHYTIIDASVLSSIKTHEY